MCGSGLACRSRSGRLRRNRRPQPFIHAVCAGAYHQPVDFRRRPRKSGETMWRERSRRHRGKDGFRATAKHRKSTGRGATVSATASLSAVARPATALPLTISSPEAVFRFNRLNPHKCLGGWRATADEDGHYSRAGVRNLRTSGLPCVGLKSASDSPLHRLQPVGHARRRQAEGGTPTIFLKARLKAASDS